MARDPHISQYRVAMVVVHLGWVDSDLGSSPGRWAVTAAICFPTRGWNILNLSQPNPGARPPWSPCSANATAAGGIANTANTT